MWHTDEMMIRSGGKWSWLWHTMDRDTRFMVANMISNSRTVEDARNLFKRVKQQAKDKPECMVTDGLQSYNDAFNKEFYTRKSPQSKHIRNAGVAKKNNNNRVERLHGTVRDRNKTQRGLEIPDSPFIKGHQLYYNFIRPHESLNGYTPAHFANIYLELDDKKWENLLMQSLKYRNGEKNEKK